MNHTKFDVLLKLSTLIPILEWEEIEDNAGVDLEKAEKQAYLNDHWDDIAWWG